MSGEELPDFTARIYSELADGITETVSRLYHQPNVEMPDEEELERRARAFGLPTQWGSYNFASTVKNRSEAQTVIIGTHHVQERHVSPQREGFIRYVRHTLDDVHEYIQHAPMVCVERSMGDGEGFRPRCRLYVSTYRPDAIRLAYMWGRTLFPVQKARGAKLNLIYIPEWQEKDRQAIVFPELGVTYVLGTDYFGEAKKGFLRMAMWFGKQKGMLGMHAGSKVVIARDPEGKVRRHGMLILGLTATGKSTHSCSDHGLTEPDEGVQMAQDDVVFWHQDGHILGTERGFYIKTEGLTEPAQQILYEAARSPRTIFENVMVYGDGTVDLDDYALTGNGRAIVDRDDLGPHKAPSINLPPVEEFDSLIIAFITRRHTVLGPAYKLSPAQAAATFMLGESVHSTGSDPTRVGESVRVVGTNPFVVGDEAEEGNRFYEFVRKYEDRIQCYMLNTGGVGEVREEDERGRRVIRQPVNRVRLAEMGSIIRNIARGAIRWVHEPIWGTQVPESVEGADLGRLDPELFYTHEQVNAYVRRLKEERRQHLGKFRGLHPDILSAFDLS